MKSIIEVFKEMARKAKEQAIKAEELKKEEVTVKEEVKPEVTPQEVAPQPAKKAKKNYKPRKKKKEE